MFGKSARGNQLLVIYLNFTLNANKYPYVVGSSRDFRELFLHNSCPSPRRESSAARRSLCRGQQGNGGSGGHRKANRPWRETTATRRWAARCEGLLSHPEEVAGKAGSGQEGCANEAAERGCEAAGQCQTWAPAASAERDPREPTSAQRGTPSASRLAPLAAGPFIKAGGTSTSCLSAWRGGAALTETAAGGGAPLQPRGAATGTGEERAGRCDGSLRARELSDAPLRHSTVSGTAAGSARTALSSARRRGKCCGWGESRPGA